MLAISVVKALLQTRRKDTTFRIISTKASFSNVGWSSPTSPRSDLDLGDALQVSKIWQSLVIITAVKGDGAVVVEVVESDFVRLRSAGG